MKLKIDNELKNLIPPLTGDELNQLEENIRKEGVREPIITWNGIIIDGHNRYNICKNNLWTFKTIEKKFKDKNEAIVWIIDNQLGRRNLNEYNRTTLGLKKKKIFEGRQGRPIKGVINDGFIGETRDKIAKQSGVSSGFVTMVEHINKNATEEIKNNLATGKTAVTKEYTNLKKKEKRAEIVQKIQETPKINGVKKYGIIYADPAWKYFESGNKNQSLHYKTMSIDDIKNLEVEKLAADDCVLFLWVTFPMLKEVFEVIESWGFNYSTCGFNWIKRNKNKDSWFFGLGNWTRANSELCLIATKGRPMRKSASVSQIIDSPIEGHSKKPDCVRDKIVELMGNDIPKIELFARNKTKGWDVWGNEA